MVNSTTDSKQRVKLNVSYWNHEFVSPFTDDVQYESLFLKHKHYLVVDVETQKLADEVGGWKNVDKLGVSVVCAFDSADGQYYYYRENELHSLKALCEQRLVIGYNIIGFDLKVLEPYGFDARKYEVFDLMLDVQKNLGRQYIKLDSIAKGTLGSAKSADGVMAVEWYRQGQIDKIIEYCLKDVEITKDVFEYGRQRGEVYIAKADGQKESVKVQWE